MSPVLAASRVLVCVLTVTLTVGPVLARGPAPTATQGATLAPARRPVAIINLDLTKAPAPIELAIQLNSVLEQHPELRAVADPGAAVALYEDIEDSDKPQLERARQGADRANSEIGNFMYTAAAQSAQTGAADLLNVTPSLVAKAYAELAFIRGKALLRDGKLADARLAFAHSARLEPGRVIDPAREPPDVIAAYTAATSGTPSIGTINVTGEGTVWIDGAEVGVAPAAFTVSTGLHAIWLTGVDRETRGIEVEVDKDQTVVAAVPMVAASARVQVQRARQLLARSNDDTTRAPAMRRLVELVDAKDALLLKLQNGVIIVQAWRDGGDTPGFGALSERGKRSPAELLESLAPRKPPPEEAPPTYRVPFDKPAWIHSTQATVVLGFTSVAVIGVGIYLLTSALRPTRLDGPTMIEVERR